MKFIYWPHAVQCPSCGYSVWAEQVGKGAQTCAVIHCTAPSCTMYGRSFRLPAQFIECEEITGAADANV